MILPSQYEPQVSKNWAHCAAESAAESRNDPYNIDLTLASLTSLYHLLSERLPYVLFDRRIILMRTRVYCFAFLAVITNVSGLANEKKTKCKACQKTASTPKPELATEATSNRKSADNRQSDQPNQDAFPVQAQIQMLANDLKAFPDNPKEGECYIRVKQDAKYKTVEESVLVREATIRFEIKPAEFKDVEKKVLVRPESVRYEVIPAKFKKKRVTVTKVPEHQELSASESKFADEQDKIEIKPERVEWKPGKGILDSALKTAKEILCLVRQPAEFQSYTRKVVDEKAKLKTKDLDASLQQVETEVLVSKAQVKEIKLPAVYKTIRVRELVKPASKKRIDVPAEFTKVKRESLIHPETLVWQRVLCNTNVTPDLIRRIQKALKSKGIDPKTKEAKWNQATQAAVRAYQKKHQLAEGGLTYEFLEHIGVKP